MKTIKLTLTDKRLDGEGRGVRGTLDALQDLLHPIQHRRWVLSRWSRESTMALAICVGFVEGGREMGRVTRRRRGGRTNVSPLLIQVFVPGVVFLVVHCGRVVARGLDATIAIPVVVVDLGGRRVGNSSGSWSGSAQIHRWQVEGRWRFERCGLNRTNLLEASLFQQRHHGLLLFLRWMVGRL
jgi:hypothetical protein